MAAEDHGTLREEMSDIQREVKQLHLEIQSLREEQASAPSKEMPTLFPIH